MVKRIYAHRTFASASDKDIAEAEKTYGIEFCDDYKAFLKTDNGLIIDEMDHDDDYDEWINEATNLFGLNDSPHYKFSDGLNSVLDPRYLKMFYSVGIDPGGNDLVQITAGARKGTLAMMDHEVYGGMLDMLEIEDHEYPDHMEGQDKLPFKTFDDATPDQILEECFKQGFLAHYPISFEKQLQNLDKLYNKIARKNKKRPKKVVPTTAESKKTFLYKTYGDTSYRIEELSGFHGDHYIFNPGEVLSWTYKVKMENDTALPLHWTLDSGNGKVFAENSSTIESNATYRTVKVVDADMPTGDVTLTLHFPETSELSDLTDTKRIKIAERPLLFTACYNEPATNAQINAAEKSMKTTFCDDFKSWLKDLNGVSIFWPHIAMWDTLDDDAAINFEAATAFNQGTDDWRLAVHQIYGVVKPWQSWNEYGNPPHMMDIERGLKGNLHFQSKDAFLSIIYPVAECYDAVMGGYYQIAQGSHRGKIVRMLDYSFSLSGIQQVKNFKRTIGHGKKAETRTYPFESFATATPDQIVQAWVDEGTLEITDMDFAQFSKTVLKAHEDAFAEMFDTYFAPGRIKGTSPIAKIKKFFSPPDE